MKNATQNVTLAIIHTSNSLEGCLRCPDSKIHVSLRTVCSVNGMAIHWHSVVGPVTQIRQKKNPEAED